MAPRFGIFYRFLLAFAAMSSPHFAYAEDLPADWQGHINLDFGLRKFDGNFMTAGSDHSAMGINFDFGKKRWPANLYLGLSGSFALNQAVVESVADDDESETIISKATTNWERGSLELSAGLQKNFTIKKLTFYASAGASEIFVRLKDDTQNINSSDSSIGWFYQAGMFWTLPSPVIKKSKINIGLSVRALQGTSLSLNGVGGDADYVQFSVVLGGPF